jgi:hypothetical protein
MSAPQKPVAQAVIPQTFVTATLKYNETHNSKISLQPYSDKFLLLVARNGPHIRCEYMETNLTEDKIFIEMARVVDMARVFTPEEEANYF